MRVELFAVGGIVRDHLINVRSKDVDLSCVVTGGSTEPLTALDELTTVLEDQGFEVFDTTPDKFTIRAQVPKGHPISKWGATTADFVLARRDGPYSDGRRPDFVEIGTFEDDIARRDFTVNALAVPAGVVEDDGTFTDPVFVPGEGDMTEHVIDLHGGLDDLARMELVFVGVPHDRIREDALRVMRAFRFTVVKGFTMADATLAAILADETVDLLAAISQDRKATELNPMFKRDTLATLDLLCHTITPELRSAVFTGDLRLKATLEH